MPPPTFKPIERSAIPKVGGARASKYAPLIERFLQSTADAAEVETIGRRPAAIIVQLKKAAKGKSVTVISRSGRVFLIRDKA